MAGIIHIVRAMDARPKTTIQTSIARACSRPALNPLNAASDAENIIPSHTFVPTGPAQGEHPARPEASEAQAPQG